MLYGKFAPDRQVAQMGSSRRFHAKPGVVVDVLHRVLEASIERGADVGLRAQTLNDLLDLCQGFALLVLRGQFDHERASVGPLRQAQ